MAVSNVERQQQRRPRNRGEPRAGSPEQAAEIERLLAMVAGRDQDAGRLGRREVGRPELRKRAEGEARGAEGTGGRAGTAGRAPEDKHAWRGRAADPAARRVAASQR